MSDNLKRSEADIIREIGDVYCDLSPENLTCDGELPKSLVNQKERKLTRKLNDLFEELGRKVTEEQAWELR